MHTVQRSDPTRALEQFSSDEDFFEIKGWEVMSDTEVDGREKRIRTKLRNFV